MQRSYEARWFFQEAPAVLTEWFDHKSLRFDFGTPSRIDFYLPLPLKAGMSIKRREGNVEIKQLIKNLGRRKFIPFKIEGKVQSFVKWSFDLSDEDVLSKSILEEKKFDWIAVPKERISAFLFIS